jgi:MoxR-like ATPase
MQNSIFTEPVAAVSSSKRNGQIAAFMKAYEVAEKFNQHITLNKIISDVCNYGFQSRSLKAEKRFEGQTWEKIRTQFPMILSEIMNEKQQAEIFSQFMKKCKPETKHAINKVLTEKISSSPAPIAAAVIVRTEPTTKTEIKTEPKTEPTMNLINPTAAAQAVKLDTVKANGNLAAGLTFNLPFGEMIETGINQVLPSIVENLIESYEERFNAAVKQEAAKQNPTVFNLNGVQLGTVSGKLHKEFPKMMRKLMSRKQIFLKGPSGSGKSFTAEQLAEACGDQNRFYQITVTEGTTANDFTGRMNAQGEFMTTPFVEAFENGGTCLIDEVDNGDPNSLVSVNNALTNGILNVPYRIGNTQIKRHPDFKLIATANTWGQGNDGNFVARNPLDEAFLKRFEGAFFEINFDTELEAELLAEAPELLEKMWALRSNIDEARLQRTIATRDLIFALTDYKSGEPINEILVDFVVRFTDYEKEKALKGLI